MKSISALLLMALIGVFFTPETKKKYYDNGKLKYQVEMENGVLNGHYTSWYRNGQKKAEGTFSNNQRTGNWAVFDTTGQLRMTRVYKNSFEFEVVSANSRNGQPIKLPDRERYDVTYNKEGYIEYPKIIEKNVVVTKRVWRTITPTKTNTPIFDGNRLFEIIYTNIINKEKPVAYDPSSDQFEKALSTAEVKDKIMGRNLQIVGYQIKEDWFFDSVRQMSEIRIIGLCPMIQSKDNNERVDLFWIYYPEIRGLLAAEKVDKSTHPSNIKTLEDVFHFRHFSSSIYKESNIYHREIADYKSGDEIQVEAERIEIGILEMEHHIWINMTE